MFVIKVKIKKNVINNKYKLYFIALENDFPKNAQTGIIKKTNKTKTWDIESIKKKRRYIIYKKYRQIIKRKIIKKKKRRKIKKSY